MITPAYGLTATERVLPRMALDFTTATLDPRVTFTRTGDTATVTNSSGVIEAINANLPRFDYDPTTLVCKGLLIEESKTNLLLNSLLNGTNLSTQLVTTTAVAHTLSFYGTGTIVLTGTSSATVVGTGAYPSRKTLTFTPTAGVLTLTVTGTVQYAQLEVGAFATSFIPTDATSKTRNADVAVMTGTNFSDWYNQSEGAFVSKIFSASVNNAVQQVMYAANAAATNYMFTRRNAAGIVATAIFNSGATQGDVAGGSAAASSFYSSAFAYKLNNFGAAINAGTVTTDTVGTVAADINRLFLGSTPTATQFLNGTIQKLSYYAIRLINAEIQAFSK